MKSWYKFIYTDNRPIFFSLACLLTLTNWFLLESRLNFIRKLMVFIDSHAYMRERARTLKCVSLCVCVFYDVSWKVFKILLASFCIFGNFCLFDFIPLHSLSIFNAIIEIE